MDASNPCFESLIHVVASLMNDEPPFLSFTSQDCVETPIQLNNAEVCRSGEAPRRLIVLAT